LATGYDPAILLMGTGRAKLYILIIKMIVSQVVGRLFTSVRFDKRPLTWMRSHFTYYPSSLGSGKKNEHVQRYNIYYDSYPLKLFRIRYPYNISVQKQTVDYQKFIPAVDYGWCLHWGYFSLRNSGASRNCPAENEAVP